MTTKNQISKLRKKHELRIIVSDLALPVSACTTPLGIDEAAGHAGQRWIRKPAELADPEKSKKGSLPFHEFQRRIPLCGVFLKHFIDKLPDYFPVAFGNTEIICGSLKGKIMILHETAYAFRFAFRFAFRKRLKFLFLT